MSCPFGDANKPVHRETGDAYDRGVMPSVKGQHLRVRRSSGPGGEGDGAMDKGTPQESG